MKDITKNVEKFYESINSIPNHRYKSWEHCYNFFNRIKDKDLDKETLDLAQLHLAFYLASWGMYRGSSFILQKDYTVFNEIVEEIFSQEYSLLWDIENNIDKKEQLSELFLILYSKIEKILRKIKESVRVHPDLNELEKRYLNGGREISSTLTTKIILGTMGCIPAYDRFFIEGLKIEKMQQKFNSKKSFIQLIGFYTENKEELNNLKQKFKNYPMMKILDMYFWIGGYEKLNAGVK